MPLKSEDYRELAEKMYGHGVVKVPRFGSVTPGEGGAFVEMVVWVPDVVEVCLGCGKPTDAMCGCPAGTGLREK